MRVDNPRSLEQSDNCMKLSVSNQDNRNKTPLSPGISKTHIPNILVRLNKPYAY